MNNKERESQMFSTKLGPVLGAARHAFKVLAVLVVIGWSARLVAQEIWPPDEFHVFSANSPARASEVNANFRWLVERVQELEMGVQNAIPPGTIVAFGGEVAPEGWLLCDGREISENDYPDLAAAIGSSWDQTGAGANVLPDLRGRFLRGMDDRPPETSLDPDRGLDSGVGSYQGHAIENIQGQMPRVFMDSATSNTEGFQPTGPFGRENNSSFSGHVGEGTADSNGDITFDASKAVETSQYETRPTNAAVNYIIKY